VTREIPADIPAGERLKAAAMRVGTRFLAVAILPPGLLIGLVYLTGGPEDDAGDTRPVLLQGLLVSAVLLAGISAVWAARDQRERSVGKTIADWAVVALLFPVVWAPLGIDLSLCAVASYTIVIAAACGAGFAHVVRAKRALRDGGYFDPR
jgi:hypothetical protein